MLTVVQIDATYQIAKADEWEQMFTDGTSRQQVAFQDLIISIKEDELFKEEFELVVSTFLNDTYK